MAKPGGFEYIRNASYRAQHAGHPLGQNSQTNDLWICATAIYHNAPLLTLNRRHFENFPGLVILS